MRTFLVALDPTKSEADKPGYWLYHQEIANPISKYAKYKDRYESWGVNVLRGFCVEIEASDSMRSFAIGHSGFAGCFLAEEHFKRFFLGADLRDVNMIRTSCGVAA